MKKNTYSILFVTVILFTVMFCSGNDYPSDGTHDIKWDGIHWVNTGDWQTSGYQTAAFDAESRFGTTTFTALRDVSMTGEIVKNSTGDVFNAGFFTYALNSSGNITILTETFNNSLNTGDTIISDNLSAGTLIGVWVESDGNKYYSYNLQNTSGYVHVSADGSYGSGHKYTYDGNGNIVEVLPDNVYGQGGIWFDFNHKGYDKSDIVIIVKGTSHTVSGVPLPGILFTQLIVFPTMAIYCRFRKKSII